MSTITPYLCVDDATAAIDFYTRAFAAEETLRLADPDGKIGHAEIQIGDSIVMLSDEFPDWGAHSPKAIGGSPGSLHLSVDDADATIARAVEAGATLMRPAADQFYGERAGQIVDPFGYLWGISHHIEDVSGDEMQRRMAEMHNSSPIE